MQLRDKVKWVCVASASLFIMVSTYMRFQWGFNYCEEGAAPWQLVAFLSALMTLVFAIFCLPKWQSLYGMAVIVYAGYWLSMNACMLP
jgi:hypothetical protein